MSASFDISQFSISVLLTEFSTVTLNLTVVPTIASFGVAGGCLLFGVRGLVWFFEISTVRYICPTVMQCSATERSP